MPLSVSRLISVSLSLTPQAAQTENFDTLLLVGSSDVIDAYERIRAYESIDDVASDFGVGSPEFGASEIFFSQSPQPTQVYIGRWVATPAAGRLVGGLLPPASLPMSHWTAIVDGGFGIAIDGGPATQIDGLNFSTATNLNGVASIVDAALAPEGGKCVWNGRQFILTSLSTGAASSVDFATAPTAGVDISGAAFMAIDAASASHAVDGMAAESALQAVVALDAHQQWYALNFCAPEITDADHLAIAAYIEASATGTGTPHIYGLTTANPQALDPLSQADIGSQLLAAGYMRTFGQYSTTSPYAAVSILGRLLTVDLTQVNSMITLMWKQQPGIAGEPLRSTDANALDKKRYNYFTTFNNLTSIVVNGTMFGRAYIDEIFGADGFANTIQTDLWNLFYTSPTKIPQTDSGVHMEVVTVQASCEKFVNNGFLAPGVWNYGGVGIVQSGDTLSKGYYVFANPISTQSQADREARKSPPITVLAKLAGAIHSVDVQVLLNR